MNTPIILSGKRETGNRSHADKNIENLTPSLKSLKDYSIPPPFSASVMIFQKISLQNHIDDPAKRKKISFMEQNN